MASGQADPIGLHQLVFGGVPTRLPGNARLPKGEDDCCNARSQSQNRRVKYPSAEVSEPDLFRGSVKGADRNCQEKRLDPNADAVERLRPPWSVGVISSARLTRMKVRRRQIGVCGWHGWHTVFLEKLAFSDLCSATDWNFTQLSTRLPHKTIYLLVNGLNNQRVDFRSATAQF